MTKGFITTMVVGLGMLAAAEAHATLLPGTASFSGSGTYSGTLGLLTDQSIPPEGQHWQTNTVWWSGTTQSFTLDYGSVVTIEELLLSVDNNDSYLVQYSSNSSSWTSLFTISSNLGEIGWGMDTFSTDSANSEYVSALNFSSIQTRYLKISAVNGDNMYSVGEIQAYGSTGSPVPEPNTMLLLGAGLSGLAFISRKRKN